MFFTSRNGDRVPPGQDLIQTAPATSEMDEDHAQRPRLTSRALPRGSSSGATFRAPPALPPPATEPATATEAAALEQEAFENAQPPHFVSQSVALLADRQIDARAEANTRVSGRVFLSGKPPAERVLPMDPRCAAEHKGPVTTRFYVTGKDNSLADVFVVISAGLPRQEWPVPREPVTLRLRGCLYENHIVGVQTDQKLLVQNLDRIMHNIHNIPAQGSGNPEKNTAILPRARPLEFHFPEPERFVRFKCDVHPWEFAYVNVVEHPFFAVTDGNGNFTINALPPGVYTIQAHHRKAGVLRKEITVEQNRNLTINFEFKAPAAEALQI